MMLCTLTPLPQPLEKESLPPFFVVTSKIPLRLLGVGLGRLFSGSLWTRSSAPFGMLFSSVQLDSEVAGG